MIVYAIDPGVKVIGISKFRTGRLIEVRMIRAKSLEKMISHMRVGWLWDFDANHRVILEQPVVYDRRAWKGDPNDLVKVAIAGGAAAAALNGEVEFVTPQRWKGGVPKKIHQPRIMNELTESERRFVVGCGPKSLIHNVIDAVGIGLWAVGRGV